VANRQRRQYFGVRNQTRGLSTAGSLLVAYPAGSYVDMFVVDRDGILSAVARYRVIEFVLRGRLLENRQDIDDGDERV
jgi:hypothetical protein